MPHEIHVAKATFMNQGRGNAMNIKKPAAAVTVAVAVPAGSMKGW